MFVETELVGMSKVIVFGAGGGTGLRVVEEARLAGHDVTAAVRDPAKATLDGVRVVAADIRDAASVQAAVDGQDAVVSAVGASGRRALGLYSDSARTLVAAMESAGVPRLIAITSAGVRHDDPSFPLWYRLAAATLMRDQYGDMRQLEETVRSSTLDWTLVRPTRLIDGEATDDYRVQDAGTPNGGSEITRADLARFIVGELGKREWINKTPTLAR
ncbi:NAD(P)-dependent oxidoreductase [Kribbella sp. NPDC051620]|uniref:NAD(P)-dependent oxidoreductase n=1 Tax=Kribbella sp. NPDC051620 TaxID=3364120 RepID=UPI00379C7273